MESLVENALAQRIGQGPLSRITSLEADGNSEESESPATAEGGTVATIGETRKSVTTAAINAIEDDIASLLATMNSEGGADDGIDAEDATLALLGELDRLWSADPMVCASSAA